MHWCIGLHRKIVGIKYPNNMSEISHLSADSLFVRVPQPEAHVVDSFFDVERVKSASYDELIDTTYFVLNSELLTLAEALCIWEIRLTLILFNDQLSVAKKEAINLNNALYLQENPNTPPPPLSRSVLPLGGSAVSLNDASSRNSDSSGRKERGGVIYPLPKNNNGQVGYLLLILLLRLKSIPNLALVNELYKFCYQVRLKGSSSEAAKVQAKLTGLSYEIIMVLTVTRNFFTLLSFLESLRQDISARSRKLGPDPQYEKYHSNVTLMWITMNLLVRAKDRSYEELREASKEFEKEFTGLASQSLDFFSHVVRNISPVIGGTPKNPLAQSCITLEELVELISKNKITGRIICCTLATWELSNIYLTKLTTEDETSTLQVEVLANGESKLDSVYASIMARWGENVHKVYGLE